MQKKIFEEFFPNFDFDSVIVEKINELFKNNIWYGPFSDSELKVVFSYDDIIGYLKNWQKFSYNYNPLTYANNDKNFQKTIESHLLDVKENGAIHYNRILEYIKEVRELSFEDEQLIDKLVEFSKEKIKILEDVKDGDCVYDDRSSR